MPAPEATYDIAISFLYKDEPLAVQIHDELTPAFRIFVFSKQQESLAGANGIEEFRQIFRANSRLVVVLFRVGWGDTPWTRIERLAVEERFLADGPDSLLFVMLEKGGAPPKWLPETRIRLNYSDYGFEQLVGAVKHRVTILGGEPGPDDALAHARKVTKDIAVRAEKERLFNSFDGVNAATAEAEKIFQQISLSAVQLNKEMPALSIAEEGKNGYYVITNRKVALRLSWYREYGNVMGRARLTAWQMNGSVPMPSSSGTVWPEPVELSEHVFFPDYSATMGLCWRNETGTQLTSDQVANWCVVTFLKLVDQKDRGELPNLLDQYR